ncbi:MAG: T9SS type A sorting domain-containing protein [Candidatus Cloacimonetes bacterium]|nr:T9SS type A sorting domain-containing protein [Candidatus Cloacimonadota bacterium]
MKQNLIMLLLLWGCAGLFAQDVQPAGTGTVADPYQVANLDNLEWISLNNTSWSSHFIQTADIDATATSSWNAGEGFSPIGIDNTDSFTGSYDGQGHIIDGLYICRFTSDYQGLFGYTHEATIEDLGTTNVNVSANERVGGLVASYRSSFTSNRYLCNCFSTGSVTGNSYVGGLAGEIWHSHINNCYSLCSVNGNFSVGGFAGDSWYTGINKCYCIGCVTGSSNVGGFLGYRSSYSSNNYCFWNTETANVPFGVGTGLGSGVFGKTTVEMKMQYTYTYANWDFVGEFANGDEDIWDIDDLNNDGYPYLSWQVYPFGVDFVADSTSVSPGIAISFTAISNRIILTWDWDFDNDGTVDSNEQYPLWTYSQGGIFSVSLTVSNGDSTTTETKMDYITVLDQEIVVTSLVPAEGDVILGENDQQLFEIDAIDPDGNELEYHWLLNGTEVDTVSFYNFRAFLYTAGNYTLILNVTDNYGNRNSLTYTWNIIVSDTAISSQNLVPITTQLSGCYPNPFNPETTIKFSVKDNETAKLEIFNIKGQLVKSYPAFEVGYHIVIWSSKDDRGKSVGSGIFFYRLTSESVEQVRKMILLR